MDRTQAASSWLDPRGSQQPLAYPVHGSTFLLEPLDVVEPFVPPPARSAGDPAAGRGVQWTSVESCQCSVPSSSTVTGALPSNCSIVASSGDWQFGHALAITPPRPPGRGCKGLTLLPWDGGQ